MDKSFSTTEVCRSAFGNHPEDVISVIRTGSELAFELEALFKAIKADLESNPPRLNAARLCDVGAYLASDIGNYIDCEREAMVENLEKAGIIDGSSPRSKLPI